MHHFNYDSILADMQAKLAQGFIDAAAKCMREQAGMINQEFVSDELDGVVDENAKVAFGHSGEKTCIQYDG